MKPGFRNQTKMIQCMYLFLGENTFIGFKDQRGLWGPANFFKGREDPMNKHCLYIVQCWSEGGGVYPNLIVVQPQKMLVFESLP